MVLEARDRLGGRTWYRELPGAGAKVEYGGTWFWSDLHTALAEEIGRYDVRVRPEMPASSLVWLADGQLRSGTGVLEDIRRALEPFEPIFDAAASRIHAAWDGDRTVLADLSLILVVSPPIGLCALAIVLAAGLAVGLLGAAVLRRQRSALPPEHRGSQVPLSVGSRSWMGGEPGRRHRERRRRSIRLVRRRARIRRRRGCDGRLADGGEVRGRAGCRRRSTWPDVAFDPPLSPEKRRIAALGNPGASTKVLAVVRGYRQDGRRPAGRAS